MQLINKILRGIGLAGLLVAVMAVPVACTDDLIVDNDIVQNSDGSYGPFDIAVSFDMEENEYHSRGTFDTNGFQLECAWVAMFNVHDGKLVSMAESDFSGKPGPDTNHNNGAGEDYKVVLRSLMLNDENSEVYIAGVANYEGVRAVTADGYEMDLIDALNSVDNIIDYKNISVINSSAEKAMGNDNKPLMAGFWGNSHGNFTVSQNGTVYTNNSAVSKVQMLDKIKKTVIGKETIEKGMLHLRRLYSHLKVGITIDPKGFKEFKNPRVKVVNVPAYTFLTEHKTIEDASEPQYNNSEWPLRTHTAADIFEDGYFDSPEISASNPLVEGSENGCFLMYLSESDSWTQTTDGSGNVSSINFGFWHYETKHWGLESVRNQNDRGRMLGNSGLYASLCPSVERSFNNNAACIVLTADVVSADGKYTGTADFYIHEGFSCKPNGDAAADLADAARDFSTFRNTIYKYTVNISGMDAIDTKVTASDMSGDFYHGVGGDLYSTTETRSMSVPEGGATYDIELPKGKLFWYIDSEGKTFGIPLNDDLDINQWYGSVYKYSGEESIDDENEFYKSIKFNDKPLGEASGLTRAGNNVISFTGDAAVSGILYLCAVHRSVDGMVTYYTVYQFDQTGELATPELYMLKDGNLVKNASMIMGIDDHSIYWKPVTGASTYTIELAAEGTMGGYKVTLNPNSDPVLDGKGTASTNIKIYSETIDGQEYLKFRIRYANSAGGMLSFLQKEDSHAVTINVTANKGTGESSDPGQYKATIYNPVWDFRSDVGNDLWYTTLIGKQNSDLLPSDLSVTFSGLTYGTRESITSKYKKFSGVYGIQPGASGKLPNASGNGGSNVFSFHSCAERGKLSFWTTSNGGDAKTDGRFVVVDYDGADTTLKSPDTASKGTGSVSSDFTNIKVTTSSFYPANWNNPNTVNVRFTNERDFVYYRIQFTPEDP